MKKKLFVLGLVCATMLSAFTGCKKKEDVTESTTEESVLSNYVERTDDKESGQVLDITTDTGDVIHLTINNKKTNVLKYDENEKTVTICDEKGNVIQSGCFLTAKWYKKYYDAVNTDCEVLYADEDANMQYIFYSYTNSEGKLTYEILGWILGSNSGFVMEGNSDKEETKDVFTDLWFEVTETDQENENYVLDPNSFEITDDEEISFTVEEDGSIKYEE